MGTIYSSAERTLVWLGPQSPETYVLFGLAKSFHERAVQRQPAKGQSSLELWRQVWEEDMLHGIGDAAPEQLQDARTRELRRLLDHPWFRRVWVIQEVALARRAEIVCGHLSVPASAFALMPSLVGVMVSPRTQALLDVMPGPLRESSKSWWKEDRDLETMLQKFVGSEASRPRDRIYALLSVSSDTSKSRAILPDYQCDEEETAQGVLRFIVFGDHPVPPDVKLPRWTVYELLLRMSWSSHKYEGLSIWVQLLSWALQDNASPALAKHIACTRLPYVNVGGSKRPDPILHVLIYHYPSSADILRDLSPGRIRQELDLGLTYQRQTAISYAWTLGRFYVAANLTGLRDAGSLRASAEEDAESLRASAEEDEIRFAYRRQRLRQSRIGFESLGQATGHDRVVLFEPLLSL